MGRLLVFKGANFAPVSIGSDDIQDPEEEQPADNSPKYVIPLTSSSSPSVGSLAVNKEKATYSSEGALFNKVGDGLSYDLSDGDTVKAIAMDFKRLSNTSVTTNGFFFNAGDYLGNFNTQYNGAYLWWNKNTSKISACQMSEGEQPSDVDPVSDVVSNDTFHRLCVASINGMFVMYMDGQKVGSELYLPFVSTNNVGNIVIGNSWRFKANDGDRAFGGYIRNVHIWTNEIEESLMADLSTIK